jgi:DNA-binding response OmpR family regulator
MEEKTKILIVDDEPINLDFFEVMLSKLGFIIGRADDGEDALEKVKSFNPDLIILDNVMPKMSGWQVTRIIKQDPLFEKYHEVPIIMFSAMDDVKDKIEGFELGIEDYITKPFNFSEVLARIRAVLRGKELYRQVVHTDKQLETASGMRARVIEFTEELGSPLKEILDSGEALDYTDSESLKGYASAAQETIRKTIAALEWLRLEVGDSAEAEIGGEAAIRDLDRRFDKHFRRLKENVDSMGDVRE